MEVADADAPLEGIPDALEEPIAGMAADDEEAEPAEGMATAPTTALSSQNFCP